MASATATMECSVLKIEKNEILRTLHQEHHSRTLFVAYMSETHNHTQADLVDQLFNRREKMARALLLLATWETKQSRRVTPGVSQDFGGNDRYDRSRVNFS